MDDFVELGIEGVDKLVDKHFHKVPDEALHLHTYHPKNLRSKTRRRRSSASTKSDIESEGETVSRRREKRDKGDMAQDPRQNSNYTYTSPEPPYPMPPQYSRESPRLRPQYTPSPPPMGVAHYYPRTGGPPYSAIDRRGPDFDKDDYHSDSHRQSYPRRPKAITRRSSSYQGPRDRDSRYRDDSPDGSQQMVRQRRDSMSSSHRMRDTVHRYGLKEEIEKNFTKSPIGITGGVAGAVVGGWAAKKLQTASGREGKYGKKSNAAITALGAAVGGLAVNAVIDKWQDKKRETSALQDEAWEEKFGPQSGDESEGDRRDRRSGRGGDRRSRRDSWDRDSRDHGYRGERDGRGYQPYN